MTNLPKFTKVLKILVSQTLRFLCFVILDGNLEWTKVRNKNSALREHITEIPISATGYLKICEMILFS